MKKSILILVLLLMTACSSASSTSNEEATAIVNQYPTLLPTPTLAVLTREIEEEDKEEAFHFLYELKYHMATGEYEHFAEEIRYPITVKVDGQPKTFIYVAEFEANFEKIFSEEMIATFVATDESELEFTDNGIKISNGIIWFDLICQDPNCDEAEFLITQINN